MGFYIKSHNIECTRIVCPNFDLTVKDLINFLYRHNFQMKTDMNVKIHFYTDIRTQNRILASKMQNLKDTPELRFGTSYLEKVDSKVNDLNKKFSTFETLDAQTLLLLRFLHTQIDPSVSKHPALLNVL